MASDRQLAANRANSKKSTGPVSPEGKQISSRNSRRHGLLAATIVLDGECLERFNFLLSNLIDQFQPRNVVESTLVETMAVARWRQMRLWAIEKAGLVHQMSQDGSNPGSPELDNPTRAAIAFRTLSDESRLLETIGRYENRFDRQFNSALDRLTKLRKKEAFLPNEPNFHTK